MVRRVRPESKPCAEASREAVVLLHGMGRSRASMWALGLRLGRVGYRVHHFPYAPPLESYPQITASLVAFLEREVAGDRYHLIGHSLGNVIIRSASGLGLPPAPGRIVMLAPPNQPPRLAQVFRDHPLYRLMMGDSGQRLADATFYGSLPAPSVPFGVIAGDRAHTPLHDEPSDGVVTVASTKLDGMADFATVHHTHTFLMNAADTFELCVRFLRDGRFK